MLGGIQAMKWFALKLIIYFLQQPKQAVDPLSEAEGSFGRSCLWADWVKRERKNTRDWHYINLSDDQQDVSEARCPENGCLIQAFYDQVKSLKKFTMLLFFKNKKLYGSLVILLETFISQCMLVTQRI